MAVLTFKSEEYRQFPEILKEYSRYESVIKGNSEKTVCEYLLDLRTFFRFMKSRKFNLPMSREAFEELKIGDLTLRDITEVRSEDIIEFLMFASFELKNGATSRMRKLSALRSLFKYMCAKKGYMENDPTANVDAPKPAKNLPKYMSLEESLLLLDTVKNDNESPTRIRDYAIIVLFLNTGMRLSELCGLNIQSLSSDLTTVRVRGKGNKERMLYLNSLAKSAIAEYLQVRLDAKYIRTSDHALFLSSRETRISPKTVQWMAHKYFEMSGLGYKGLSVHKLRHTAATLMYQTGEVDIRILKEVLGHEQLNTTQIYTHVVNRNIESAINSNPLSSKKK
ncbi:MAG: tyrosine-type recombinase/integrase [Clostridia bacterium]|nr:tyrosine-type recombinase/integrase [Clostridia bacterium]MBQ8289814.1 tyrosine-type recombinase/integrase [Clostridia bacterium]